MPPAILPSFRFPPHRGLLQIFSDCEHISISIHAIRLSIFTMRCLCLRSLMLQCLIAITLLSLSAAQITQQQFEASFKLYPATGPGGCNRDAPNGTPMLNYVLQSLDDAWTMASTAVSEMQLYFSGYSGRRTRPLLFLFFGVKFTEDYNFEPDGTSENTYSYVLSTLQT